MTPEGVEFTTEDFYQLLGIGVLVSAASALATEKLIKPILVSLVKHALVRAMLVRFAPVVVCIILTFSLLPLAIVYWTPAVDADMVTWPVHLILGTVGGAGSSWAYSLWDGIVRRFLEQWTGGSLESDR